MDLDRSNLVEYNISAIIDIYNSLASAVLVKVPIKAICEQFNLIEEETKYILLKYS